MKKFVICLMIVLVAAVAVVPLVWAEELSVASLNTIRTNCVAAQSDIQRIGRNDTISRVNRGRSYDAILKLFDAMNTRAANNNIDEPQLAEIAQSFELEVQNFRNKYNSYSSAYKASVSVDCVGRPTEFYNLLVRTRASRLELHNSINKLDGLINNYKAAVSGLVL